MGERTTRIFCARGQRAEVASGCASLELSWKNLGSRLAERKHPERASRPAGVPRFASARVSASPEGGPLRAGVPQRCLRR
eukprot:4566657-Pyramimonas_sp.AAC.1